MVEKFSNEINIFKKIEMLKMKNSMNHIKNSEKINQ
jgi:hypothetical protein